jgi:ribokinase
MGRVVVLGSLIVDMVARAAHLPGPGETLLSTDFGEFLGGKGCNQAVAAARQRAQVTMIGRVGADAHGESYAQALGREGIDGSGLRHDPEVGTGMALIYVGEDTGQNMIIVAPLANMRLTTHDVESALDSIKPGADADDPWIFLTQCEIPLDAMRAGLARARRAGALTILNPAPAPSEPLDDATLALADVLTPNESEATALSGVTVDARASAELAAQYLLSRGPRHVIITLGRQGYLWSSRDAGGAIAHIYGAALDVRAVDVTAAGDTFCGTLAASLAASDSMENALRRANAAAAISVTRKGAQPSIPSAAEVDAMLAQTDQDREIASTPED